MDQCDDDDDNRYDDDDDSYDDGVDDIFYIFPFYFDFYLSILHIPHSLTRCVVIVLSINQIGADKRRICEDYDN